MINLDKEELMIRFPPDRNEKRTGCKIPKLNYWVIRQESVDSAGNMIVNFYANADKSFTEKYYLRKHEKLYHTSEQPERKFKCTTCDDTFMYSSHLKNHVLL